MTLSPPFLLVKKMFTSRTSLISVNIASPRGVTDQTLPFEASRCCSCSALRFRSSRVLDAFPSQEKHANEVPSLD